MAYPWEYEPTVDDAVFACSVGREILKYIRHANGCDFACQADSEAVRLVSEIKKILDDDVLDDKDCFERIDAIVDAFYSCGLTTTRHLDWK